MHVAGRLNGAEVGIRRVLGIAAAFISRISTEQVFRMANTVSVTETARFNRLRFLGHMVRHPGNSYAWITVEGCRDSYGRKDWEGAKRGGRKR